MINTNHFIRKSAYCILISMMFVLLSACSEQQGNSSKKNGGTFALALDHEPTTWSVRNITDVYSSIVLRQIVEGLVTLNPKTMEIKPCLATDWKVSQDGKTIRFFLRDNVFFHSTVNYPDGIPFTPEDVIYSVEMACTPINGKESFAYSSIYEDVLVGATEFFNGKSDHIKGLTIEGKTITFQLTKRDVNFINKLAQPYATIVSKKVEQSNLKNKLIGTGPFKLYNKYQGVGGRSTIDLIKNELYYQYDDAGNQFPYLDTLRFIVEPNKKEQLKLFQEGKLLLIDGLPPSKVSSVLSKGNLKYFNSTPPKMILVREPLLATQYYVFNMKKDVFKDIRVRKAINYAINRDVIVRRILHNQAYQPGTSGIIPPAAFEGYNSAMVNHHSYLYHPKTARKLLARAGYPDGEEFPTITLSFNFGDINLAVAEEVARQLKSELNINVELSAMSFQQLLNYASSGEGDIYRTSWYADYYSPESFLMNTYSQPNDSTQNSKTNFANYYNPKFNAAFEEATSSDDIIQRYTAFAKAESILMDDAPFIILWYDETIKIIYAKVRNMHFNKMNFYTFKKVYLNEWTQKEWLKTHSN